MAFSNGNLRWIPGPQTPDCLKYEGGQAGGGGDLPPRYANAASIVRDSTIVPNLVMILFSAAPTLQPRASLWIAHYG